MLDNFYITLPSNSSMNQYPENKMSDYTTQLAGDIFLNGFYEVALTEIDYSPYLSVNLGNITIDGKFIKNKYDNLMPFDNTKINIKINIKNGCSDRDFCDYLNKMIEKAIVMFELDLKQELYYKPTSEKLLQQIENNNKSKKDPIKIILFYHLPGDYFLLDSNNSVFAENYRLSGGIFLNDINKWKFTDITALQSFFSVRLIQVEPLMDKHNSEEIKSHAYISYLKSKVKHNLKELVEIPISRKKRMDTTVLNEQQLLEYEYSKRKEYFTTLCDIYKLLISEKTYNDIGTKRMPEYDTQLYNIGFESSEEETFRMFFSTPFERNKYFYKNPKEWVETVKDEDAKFLRNLNYNLTPALTITRDAMKYRFLWLKHVLKDGIPTINDYQKLFTPYEFLKFENLTIADIVSMQSKYWENNDSILKLKLSIVEFLSATKKYHKLMGLSVSDDKKIHAKILQYQNLNYLLNYLEFDVFGIIT